MDFGIDNEYESDDSFFDEPKLTKRNSLTKTGEHKSVDDLFGSLEDKAPPERTTSSLENVNHSPIKPKVRFDLPAKTQQIEIPENKTTLPSKNVDWLGQSTPEPVKKDLSKRESKSLDILDDIFTTSGNVDKKSSSLGILDDILPRGKQDKKSAPTSFSDILKESKLIANADTKSMPENKFKAVPEPSRTTGFVLQPNKEGRRGRRGSGAAVEDVLGLFGEANKSDSADFTISSSKPQKEDISTHLEGVNLRQSMQEEVPDWLGGTTAVKSNTTISTIRSESTAQFQEATEVRNPKSHIEQSAKQNDELQKSSQDLQNSFAALQQQESFLLVSMQLKKYEESLYSIKKQQEQILTKQEEQFEQFLSTYIAKQQGIEHNMMEQQKRINDHIRNLMSTDSGISVQYSKSSKIEDEEDGEEQADNHLIQHIKQRHHEELFLMEESYKKQITLLEQFSAALEERLSHEIACLNKNYEDKIEIINSQHENEKSKWETKLTLLEENHKQEIAKLKEHETRLINEIKEEHLATIERLKEARSQESELLSNGVEFTRKLDGNVESLSNNAKLLQALQDKVVNDYDVLSLAREQSIQAKEKEIVMMRSTLERCRESAEKERSQMLGLIRSLEDKLAQQSLNSQEERWALQQAAATLAARSAAMDREAEFSRAAIEREREQLKTLKESLLQEQERITLQLTEEKLQIAAEKTRQEISSKLVNGYEIEKIKTEAQTAINVARELTEQLNQERDHIQRQKVELDNVRRNLMKKERELADKEMDLETLSRQVEGKINEDKRMIRDAKYLEDRYKEKLNQLQKQAISLTNREKKLSEEKLMVSKERLALYTAVKQKKCMLCKAEDEPRPTGFDSGLINMVDRSKNMTTDPELLRLRMEAMADDDKNSDVSREDSQKFTI